MKPLALDLHATWAWVVIIGNGLAGIWTLCAWKMPSIRSRAQWWFVIFAQIAVFIQVILGTYLVGGKHLEVNAFHMFYGFVALIFIMILYSYRIQLSRKLYPIYGFGCLFLMGLGIRAMLKA